MYTPEQLKAEGLDDFRVFLRQVWDHLGHTKPTPLQNDMAKYLQHGPRRRMIQAFRGASKSYETVAYVLWRALMDPNIKIMVVSAGEELANNISFFIKQLIAEMPLLQHLKANTGQRDSNEQFDFGPAESSKDPSVKSVGITGQLTGSRADIIIPDDIETPKNSYTHPMRSRIAELVKEFDSVLKPGGEIIYLGTPQVEDSLYNKLPERGYAVRIWPSEVPEAPSNYGNKLAPFITKMIESGTPAKTPTEPTRFDREDLNERQLSNGKAGYALQFLLDTTPSSIEKHPLKTKDLIVMDLDDALCPAKLVWGGSRELIYNDLASSGFDGDFYARPAWKSDDMVSYQGTVMAIDPSGRGKDETGYAIVRLAQAHLYLVAVGGFKSGYSEDTLNALAAKAVRHQVNYVIAETNFGGGMFNQLLKPKLITAAEAAKSKITPRFLTDEEYNGFSSSQKELRILNTLEPLIQNHKLVVDKRVIEQDLLQAKEDPRYSFIYQMTRMFREKGALAHEDRLEAVQMACDYWQDRMDRDAQKMYKKHQDTEITKKLEGFIKHALGRGSRSISIGGGPSRHRFIKTRR